MNVPYSTQLSQKQAAVEELLNPVVSQLGADISNFWQVAARSPENNFRNKAKMVVTGTASAPRLGILDPDQHPKHHDGTGIDLRHCGIYEPGLRETFPVIARAISEIGLIPYSVGTRQGELKHLIITISPQHELMIRFVLRSTNQLAKLQAHLESGAGLIEQLTQLGLRPRVVTANILPEHQALLEGEREIHLAGDPTLTMLLNGIPLQLRSQGFFQTNTVIAAELYWQAAEWVKQLPTTPTSVWDLYAGVGGFGFHLAQALTDEAPEEKTTVWGVETSEQAIEAAQRTAAALNLTDTVQFVTGDATELAETATGGVPELVVVNPPRRGIGTQLAGWLNAHAGAGENQIQHVLYSSCNATTLARDLESMSNFVPVKARLLDMFPQTPHGEVLMLLSAQAVVNG